MKILRFTIYFVLKPTHGLTIDLETRRRRP